MTDSVNPGNIDEPNYDRDDSFEELNQVVIHTASGRKHRVDFAVRSTHPDAEWVYASRILNIEDSGDIITNDLVLRGEQVESIESDSIGSESFEGGSHIMHYAGYNEANLGEGWKANGMFGLEPMEERSK
jgi:hypothetical protein